MKNPVALLINDIHVSPDNIVEFHKNWNEAIDTCKKYDVKDIIIGGDLWQSRSAQKLPTLLAVREALLKSAKSSINVTIASGNHDIIDQESLLSYNHIYSEYQLVDIIDDFAIIDFSDKMSLYVLRYFPEKGSFSQHYKEMCLELDHSKTNILYLHQGINGGLAYTSDDELPASMFGDFDAVLVGHYHNRKRIPGTNVEYIGSSRQHNFGEDEDKGYTILYSDGSYDFVKNEVNTRYCTVELDAGDVDGFRLEKSERYKYRVKVSCNEKQAKLFDKQKLLDLGFYKVEVVTESTVSKESAASGIQEKYDKQGIKKEYLNYCNENSIDSKLGIKYLEG